MMRKHVKPHRAAMVAIDEAEAARRQNNEREERKLLGQALLYEKQAASEVEPELEPTRSILYRSAAAIALRLGDVFETRTLALAALRGSPPPTVRDEVFEILDGLSPFGNLSNVPHTTQQLRIRKASSSGAELLVPAVSEISSQWVKTLSALDPTMEEAVFLDASAGSYAVRFELRGTENTQDSLVAALENLSDLASLLTKSRLSVGKSRARIARLSAVAEVVELISALSEANVELEVSTKLGPTTLSCVLRPPAKKLLRELQEAVSKALPSVKVPQADDLGRVLRFVTLVSEGSYPTSDSLGVTPRQVNYYRSASEILGFIQGRRLTPGGALLARFSGRSRWRHVLEHLTTSEVGAAWIMWSNVENVLDADPRDAESFLSESVVGLSPATTKRRAATLSSWHEKLLFETQ